MLRRLAWLASGGMALTPTWGRAVLEWTRVHRPGRAATSRVERRRDRRRPSPWVTLVWNDPVNLMSYVTYVFQSYFGYRPGEGRAADARRAREGPGGRVAPGRARRWSGDTEAMHGYGLWATFQKDELSGEGVQAQGVAGSWPGSTTASARSSRALFVERPGSCWAPAPRAETGDGSTTWPRSMAMPAFQEATDPRLRARATPPWRGCCRRRHRDDPRRSRPSSAGSPSRGCGRARRAGLDDGRSTPCAPPTATRVVLDAAPRPRRWWSR